MIFSSLGGSGVEDIARQRPDRVARHTIDIRLGLRDFEARELARKTGPERQAAAPGGRICCPGSTRRRAATTPAPPRSTRWR